MQFGGAFDGHYEKFKKAWSAKRAFSCLLPEPVRRIREAVEKVFGTDPRAEVALILNPGKRGSPAYGLMADKNQIHIASD